MCNLITGLRARYAAVVVAAVVVVVACARPADSQTASSAAFDEAGVRATVSKRIDGQQKLDARLSAEAFADDGIWINAFGRRLVGRQAIESFLSGLYADPGYAQRQVFVPKEIAEIVFVRPDVAIARTFSRHGNQRLPNGTMIPERRSHNTMTLTREHEGWKIRYEIVTDERDSSVRP